MYTPSLSVLALASLLLPVLQGDAGGGTGTFGYPWVRCEVQRVQAPIPRTNQQLSFDASLSADGRRAVLGAPLDRVSGSISSGTAYVFERRGPQWFFVQRLKPEAPDSLQLFGTVVAQVGDRIFVGAPGDPGITSVGAFYVFDLVGETWVRSAKVVAADGAVFDTFGYLVPSPTGDLVICGSAGQDEAGTDAGAAYVFEEVGGEWAQTAKLVPDDLMPGDVFGAPLAFVGDELLIAARRSDAAGVDAGAVYVFQCEDGAWVQSDRLLPSAPVTGGVFGTSLDACGQRVLIGASEFGPGVQGTGGAFLFERGPSGWSELAHLTNADGDWALLGFDVSLDGDRAALLGRLRSSTDPDLAFAAVLLFEQIGGSWRAVDRYVSASQTGAFGTAVELRGDDLYVGEPFSTAGGKVSAGTWKRFDLSESICRLTSAPPELSLSAPELRQEILLHYGEEYAGLPYLLLGSGQGTAPGFQLQGRIVRLNPDPYFLQTLQLNQGWFTNNFGFLDERGQAQVPLVVGVHPFAALLGSDAHHVALVFDSTLSTLLDASNPVPMQIVP